MYYDQLQPIAQAAAVTGTVQLTVMSVQPGGGDASRSAARVRASGGGGRHARVRIPRCTFSRCTLHIALAARSHVARGNVASLQTCSVAQ